MSFYSCAPFFKQPSNEFINNVFSIFDRYLIGYVRHKKESIFVGVCYAMLLFIAALLQATLKQQYFDSCFTTGTKMRIAFMNLIYKKVRRSIFL